MRPNHTRRKYCGFRIASSTLYQLSYTVNSDGGLELILHCNVATLYSFTISFINSSPSSGLTWYRVDSNSCMVTMQLLLSTRYDFLYIILTLAYVLEKTRVKTSDFKFSTRVHYRVYKKKLNKPEIALRLCKAPQCTKFFIEIGCLGTDNVV